MPDNTEMLVKALKRYADDPMWADHAEVPKSLLNKAALALQSTAGETWHASPPLLQQKGTTAMSNYDNWKSDPDPHGVDAAAIEAREKAAFEEACRIKKLEMKSAALGWFADFARRIDGANWSELHDLERRVGRMPDLLLSYSREEIKF